MKGSSEVVKTRRQTDSVSVRTASGSKVANIPPLEIIGRTYKVTKAGSIYAQADSASSVVRAFQAGEAFEVTGKVKDADWYFVSQNGVGIGFASISQFSKEPEAISPDSATPKTQTEEAQAQVVQVEREYKTISQEVVLADGTIHTEEVTLVKDTSGKWIKAEKVG